MLDAQLVLFLRTSCNRVRQLVEQHLQLCFEVLLPNCSTLLCQPCLPMNGIPQADSARQAAPFGKLSLNQHESDSFLLSSCNERMAESLRSQKYIAW